MPDNQNRSLMPTTGASLENVSAGVERVLTAMVGEALAVIHRESISVRSQMFRIGDHEFCEPDYRQVICWAKALEVTPETIIDRLLDERPCPTDAWDHFERIVLRNYKTRIKNGKFETVLWRLALLPLRQFEWVDGLSIETLTISNLKCETPFTVDLNINLPELRVLSINPVWNGLKVEIKRLEFSNASKLEEFTCQDFSISEIDLAKLPKLKKLWCCGVPPLADCDFSCVPELEDLDCSGCCVEEIDLSGAESLIWLCCKDNELTGLDVTALLELIHLNCSQNPIEVLDLSGNPFLRKLVCCECNLTELDLSQNCQLEFLACNDNSLTHLDLSQVPFIEVLCCERNAFEEIDIRPLRHLKTFQCDAPRVLHRPDQDLKQMAEWAD